jgi:hypothetical protein
MSGGPSARSGKTSPIVSPSWLSGAPRADAEAGE